MFNILVVDSIENELNHLIFLLEDYKAENNNFDKILNIIDANSEQEAIDILNKEKFIFFLLVLIWIELLFKHIKK